MTDEEKLKERVIKLQISLIERRVVLIFPDISPDEWNKKYPTLKILKTTCEGCYKTLLSNKPFITKGYAGFTAELCECGGTRSIAESVVTTTQDEFYKWSEVFNKAESKLE